MTASARDPRFGTMGLLDDFSSRLDGSPRCVFLWHPRPRLPAHSACDSSPRDAAARALLAEGVPLPPAVVAAIGILIPHPAIVRVAAVAVAPVVAVELDAEMGRVLAIAWAGVPAFAGAVAGDGGEGGRARDRGARAQCRRECAGAQC